jgi:hypothetical protein
MKYKQIELPIKFTNCNFDNSDFLQWFLNIIPERLEEISRLVKKTSSNQNLCLDYSSDSLDFLSDWFPGQIKLRKRTDTELAYESARMNLPSGIELSNLALDHRTESICVDLGIYVGEFLRKKNQKLVWSVQKQKSKSWKRAASGYPVLQNSKKISMDSVMVINSLATLIANSIRYDSLKEVTNIWEKKLTV